jgi:DNA repair protein RadA/Sms
MSKLQTIYVCQKCGAQSPKWSGRCFNCGQWGSLEERAAENKKQKTERETKNFLKTEVKSRIVGFDNVSGQDAKRIKSGIEEFDRVLGGGIVPGAIILMTGEPGVGKSTLVAQVAAAFPKISLYISGEESASQLKLRFDRLNLNTKNLRYLGETEAGMIAAAIEEAAPGLVIVDSIQTIRSDEVDSEAGTANQIKISAAKIADAAKSRNIPVVIIGHITKEGKIAGPKTLEHLVDVVLNLEGDGHSASRILRTPKNRFGSTDEIGIFQMKESGLAEVKNPSELFLEGRSTKPGSIITCVIEGTRPILVEVQALLSRSDFRFPQRRAAGFDLNRLQMIATTLAKRGGLYLFKYDIHLNIAGGLKIKEPFADLAVALAIASAYLNRTIDQKMAAFGEIGLGGEIRPVANLEKRLKEAEKMGFKYVIANPGTDFENKGKIEILPAKNINEAIDIIK